MSLLWVPSATHVVRFSSTLMRKQRYLMVVNLVKRHPVEELVSKLKSGKTIVKEQVVRESRLLESQKPICLLIDHYE